ncbi:MAG: hypothetical protein ABIK27_04865 [Bacteroidota bacterium]
MNPDFIGVNVEHRTAEWRSIFNYFVSLGVIVPARSALGGAGGHTMTQKNLLLRNGFPLIAGQAVTAFG